MRLNGFTLAELLMALAILGVIATFTIPKVLQSQQNGQYKAISKEAASAVSGAWSSYTLKDTPAGTVTFSVLTPYLNYVAIRTTGTIDSKQTQGSIACANPTPCLMLHNGAALRYNSNDFGGTGTINALEFFVDPNGVDGGTTDGPDKSVNFFLYFNGRLVTRGATTPGTVASGGTVATPNPSFDPPWFGWD